MFRAIVFGLVISAALVMPAAAQERARDLAVGVSATGRTGSEGLAPGGGVAVGYRVGRLTPMLEVTGTRRDGHNDWRALAGLRLWVRDGARGGLYVHGGAGTLIRNSEAGAALMAGLGVEWRAPGGVAVRLQGDLTRDRADAVTAGGGRVSAWLVVR